MKVVLENVSYYYGRDEVLHDISLEIGAGITLLLGPNGSGKTTMLKIMSGLLIPRSGRVVVNDTVVSDLGERERALLRRKLYSIMPQEDIFLEPYSCYQNILFPLDVAGYRADEKMLDRLVELFGFRHLLKKKPGGLSGGERRKLSLIRALIKYSASIFLLDEPTASLDIESVRNLGELLREAYRDKIVVIATHDTELLKYADKKIYLRAGRLIAVE